MHIKTLRVQNFRNLKEISIDLHPKLNIFYGDNGAGKTSLLEALVVLSRGKSFKTVHTQELTGEEATSFQIFLESEFAGKPHKMGLERSGNQWKARKDGQDVGLLSVLTRQLPLVLMEPNSHQLISGSPEGRRRFLDWGVFHVEPTFLETWRRYSRALRQRNAALRSKQLQVLESINEILVPLGEQLDASRQSYYQQLSEAFSQQAKQVSPQVGDIRLEYHRGWKGDSLKEALDLVQERDFEKGVTSQGPHRADLLITRERKSIRALLSRGEQKGLAAALLLTQARLLEQGGEKPLVLLDDLASEFDQEHFSAVLESAAECAGQIWITGTEDPCITSPHKTFHVEHGLVQEMV
jgi:DNA replication and repair protein RecF